VACSSAQRISIRTHQQRFHSLISSLLPAHCPPLFYASVRRSNPTTPFEESLQYQRTTHLPQNGGVHAEQAVKSCELSYFLDTVSVDCEFPYQLLARLSFTDKAEAVEKIATEIRNYLSKIASILKTKEPQRYISPPSLCDTARYTSVLTHQRQGSERVV